MMKIAITGASGFVGRHLTRQLASEGRARQNGGYPCRESTSAAEQIIRNPGLDYTIVKAGMVYGRGDHMLDHLSHSLHTLPFFATVGVKDKPIRPLAVDDLVHILRAAL